MNDFRPNNAPVCHAVLIEVPLRFPFWRYRAMYAEQAYSFLLDSALPSRQLGRFSFLGGDPFLIFRAKRLAENQEGREAAIEIVEMADEAGEAFAEPKQRSFTGLPFEELRALLKRYPLPSETVVGRRIPFLAGAVGYVGYESKAFLEQLPESGEDDLGLPDIYLLFVSVLLAHCHETGKTYLSVTGRGADLEAAKRNATRLRARFSDRLEAFEREWEEGEKSTVTEQVVQEELSGHFTEAEYCCAVETIKEHIAKGDAYQVCLTRRLEMAFKGRSAWKLYEALRRISPAPFAAYLDFPEVQVVCSSPERFLSYDAEGVAESRPIKGTRPRGDTKEEDERLRQELESSEKDRAENVMIVDLVRNDFGRVCAYGTVKVSEQLRVEAYSTVFQLVSAIQGRLAEKQDRLDLFQACFPGGSMTGAPKIEAMKIIDRLEPVQRGIYSGAIGYFDFGGTMDWNIVIRTILVKNERCYFHVGGGIVADSMAEDEYRETEVKAKALILSQSVSNESEWGGQQ